MSTTYTVKDLADLAGVTVRTLHHYDQIGLLSPAGRTDAGYRLYGQEELLQLQQIMFYRELDMSLHSIIDALVDPNFDQIAALREHRAKLEGRQQRLATLIRTIDRTIEELEEHDMPLSDKDLYEGFDKETAERYQREARERYDSELVEESEKRLRGLSKEQWQAVKSQGDEITRAIASLMDHDPSDEEVQTQIARHHAWIEHFYPASAETYAGLGQMYTSNDEFRAFYDRFAHNLADFMCAAMVYYADHSL